MPEISSFYGIKVTTYYNDRRASHFYAKYGIAEVLTFINAYKSTSSRLIKKEFLSTKSKLWEEHFWSRSFYKEIGEMLKYPCPI